jgi:hypothetical protein
MHPDPKAHSAVFGLKPIVVCDGKSLKANAEMGGLDEMWWEITSHPDQFVPTTEFPNEISGWRISWMWRTEFVVGNQELPIPSVQCARAMLSLGPQSGFWACFTLLLKPQSHVPGADMIMDIPEIEPGEMVATKQGMVDAEGAAPLRAILALRQALEHQSGDILSMFGKANDVIGLSTLDLIVKLVVTGAILTCTALSWGWSMTSWPIWRRASMTNSLMGLSACQH